LSAPDPAQTAGTRSPATASDAGHAAAPPTTDAAPSAAEQPPAEPSPHRRRSRRSPLGVAAAGSWDFVTRVYRKLDEDNLFFLAGAIAFKVVIAIVPLMLATIGIAGLLLQSRFGASAADQVIRYVFRVLPPFGDDMTAALRQALDDIIQGASGLIGVGTLVLIWLSTSLVGTLRTALREIFDLQEDRGVVGGKLFDIQMVIAAGTLLAVNVGLTVVLRIVGSLGTSIIGIEPARFAVIDHLLVNSAAFLSIWFMFVLIYRYLPTRRIQWRIAMIAATFTGLLFELLKAGFGWYVTHVAVYRSTYGNFATIFIFLLWIYYMAVAFVIGGEVGQVAALLRIRRRQKERLH
jgi:membrane protein